MSEIAKLAYGTKCNIVIDEPKEKCAKVLLEGIKIYIPMGQLVDSDKEKERLKKEIQNVKFEIERSQRMLSNEGFVSKAPQNLIDNEKIKLETNKNRLIQVEKEIEEYN